MVKIRLHGYLGRLCGKERQLDVQSWNEAVRALQTLSEPFRNHSRSENFQKRLFAVYADGKAINKDDPKTWTCHDRVDIYPLPQGRKSGGLLNIIVGAVMIVASVWTGGMTGTLWAAMSSSMMMAGCSLVLGGLVQLISPQNGMGAMKEQQATENQPSYAFGGAVNTTAAGYPYPIPYGKRSVGGVILSSLVESEDIAA